MTDEYFRGGVKSVRHTKYTYPKFDIIVNKGGMNNGK